MISKESLFTSKKSGMFILFLFAITFSFGQLDSAEVNLQFTTGPDLEDPTLTVDILNVNTTLYDVDFMGEVIVTIYEGSANFPLARIKMTLQEFIDAGLKNGNVVTTSFPEIDPNGSYHIETIVRNDQGANLPIISTDYNI